jgi:hypothetical protein
VRVAEICCKAGISQATYFKLEYDGWLPMEFRRLKQLKDENANPVLLGPANRRGLHQVLTYTEADQYD